MARNFRPKVTEPPGSFAVELEFYDRITGLSGDTVKIYLKEGTTLKQAEDLSRLLAELGEQFTVTNAR